MWYNIKNFKRRKRMIKSRESLEAVYIYIYIVSFNKIALCKYSKEDIYFSYILNT